MKIKEKINKKTWKNTIKNKTKNIFYKLNPCGISLIVLVITIIVIIILATAIILTLSKNNPIAEANRARYENDRDDIQAIFTNTVTKIMAKNQGNINIKAGEINNIKNGVNSATGEVMYTLENPEKSENKEGKIIFDNKENTEVEYYVGKKLPIYKAGETIWSVDSEGIINLKVGGKTVGDNENSESGNDEEDEKGENVTISKEEYNNIKSEIQNVKEEIQNLKNKPMNIEKVNLMNTSVDISLPTSYSENGNYANISLSDSLENYKYIEIDTEIVCKGSGENIIAYPTPHFIATNMIKYNNSNTSNWSNESIINLKTSDSTEEFFIGGWFKNNNSLHIGIAHTNKASKNNYYMRIKSIYGIR